MEGQTKEDRSVLEAAAWVLVERDAESAGGKDEAQGQVHLHQRMPGAGVAWGGRKHASVRAATPARRQAGEAPLVS